MNISPVAKAWIRHVPPQITPREHTQFMEREIPDSLDRRRADALLQKLSEAQLSELAWIGRPEWTLKQIRLGQVQFEVIPHRTLNMISNHLGYHWNGVDYV